MRNKLRFLVMAGMALVIAGCATAVPNPVGQIPPGNPSLAEVRDHLGEFTGKRVRWGGTIIGVDNRADQTWLEILDRPLDTDGRPRESGESLGRFIARTQGFRDPAVYATGREVTVIGTVGGKLTRPVGQYPYTYIVIDAETTRLWEQYTVAPYYRDMRYYPFYDPFFPGPINPWYPWYPAYPYPYWH